MPAFNVKTLLQSLKRVEDLFGFRQLHDEESEFSAAIAEMPFEAIEVLFTSSVGQTRSCTMS